MLRVFRVSGEEALAVQFDKLARMLSEEEHGVTILAVKRHLQPLCGQPRFKQRLLRADGQKLSDDELLEGPMDAQLILESFRASSEDEIRQLQDAAYDNDLPLMERLLARPQDPDLECGWQPPALHQACMNGCLEAARLLLEAEADKDKRFFTGATPILLASAKGHPEVVQLLLQVKADKDKAHDDGTTPLLIASLRGRTEVVQVLLEANADKDKADSCGFTALFLACSQGRLEVVQLLLQANADMDKASNRGITPLLEASLKGHMEVYRVLLEANADQEQADNDAASMYVVPKRRRLE